MHVLVWPREIPSLYSKIPAYDFKEISPKNIAQRGEEILTKKICVDPILEVNGLGIRGIFEDFRRQTLMAMNDILRSKEKIIKLCTQTHLTIAL